MAALTTFRDLTVWQEAHKLVLAVYQTTTTFPGHEQYGLVSQMRRAAVSVPANIVGGFKRRGHQDKVRFYNIAEASLEELRYYLILAHDLAYVTDCARPNAQADIVGRLLHRFIESARRAPTP
jgi:four helix bundle protein